MDLAAGQVQVVLCIAAEQGDVARGEGQHVLDQRAGKPEAAVIAKDRARLRHDLDARGRRIGKADGFQRVESRLMDAFHPGGGQGFVLPAGHARAHGPQVVGQGCPPCRDTGRPPAGAQGRALCTFGCAAFDIQVSHAFILSPIGS